MTGGSEGGACSNDDKANKGGSGRRSRWDRRAIAATAPPRAQPDGRSVQGADDWSDRWSRDTQLRDNKPLQAWPDAAPPPQKKQKNTHTDRRPRSQAPGHTARQCPGDKTEKGVHRNGVRTYPKHDKGRTRRW